MAIKIYSEDGSIVVDDGVEVQISSFSYYEEDGETITIVNDYKQAEAWNDFYYNIQKKDGSPAGATMEEVLDYLASVSGGGSPSEDPRELLYLQLNSSQNLNVISPFVDLDFVEVTNTITGATVSSAFPIGAETYKGVVTLPAGKYKTSFKVNVENGNNSQKIVVLNISRYAPSVEFYSQSATYSLNRGNGSFGSIHLPDSNFQWLELTDPQSFGIIGARTSGGGDLDSVADQSYWVIEKIG